MKKLAALGLAMSLSGGAGACGNENKEASGIRIKAEQDSPMYERVNDFDSETAVIKAGQIAVAKCFYESATLASNSVMVEVEQDDNTVEGFAFTFRGDDERAPTFNKSDEELSGELPDCDTPS